MNKLVILAKNPNTYFIRRLMEERGSSKIELVNPWESSAVISQQTSVLVRTTAIHGSDKDLRFLEQQNAAIIPSLRALKTFRTKPSQFDYFANNDLPFVPWMSLVAFEKEDLEAFCKSHAGPLLIKPHRGQGGWGVQVFENKTKLLEWMSSTTDHEYLLQPYLGEHQELRLFFKQDDFICLERLKNGVTANFKQDGEARLSSVPQELREIVDKIRKEFRLVYGACDFLINAQGAYLLEMNLVPGIEQLEAVTGRNIAQELWEVFI